MLLLSLLACKDKVSDTSVETYDPPWPSWTMDHWVWEDESTQESALALVDGYLDRDIPVGAIIIDSPWETDYNTFEWDTERFPDPQGMIDELHSKDVKVFLWITPALNVGAPNYDELVEKGWFMQSSETSGPSTVDWWKGTGALIDYWNPEALTWWHGQMDKTLAYGIDGWKCDGLDFSASFVPYSPAAGRKVSRIEYSHAYYRDFHDYTREQLGDERVNTVRPIDNYGFDYGGEAVSFAPVDIVWAGWVGDQDADFGGLTAALLNFYHSSDYGYVLFGSDIGGYREDGSELGRTKEVLIRWTQLGAFSPIMENGGGGAHEPWRFDEETVTIYRDFVELHYVLLPYLHAEGAKAMATDDVLMRFPDQEGYEYFLGPDLFVAPMLEEGESRTLELPEGDWLYLFSGEPMSGTVTLDVPYDEFPVFYRKGSDVGNSLRAAL